MPKNSPRSFRGARESEQNPEIHASGSCDWIPGSRFARPECAVRAAEAHMNVHVVGGGPAGLYFAILMKKAWPHTRITVFERNKPDDTFGFGVVFSDQTLEAFESYDRETYRQIVGHFAYWDDIEIHFRGIDAPHRRQRLLRHLAGDAAENSRPPRAFARHRHQVRLGSRSGQDDDPRRRPGGRGRRHQLAHARAVQGPLQAEHRASPQPLLLDGLGPADGRVQLLLPRDAARHLHRALLPVPARPLDLGDGDRSGDVQARRPRQARRGRLRPLPRRRVRRGARRPQADHQPLAVAQFSDHPLREAGPPTTSC